MNWNSILNLFKKWFCGDLTRKIAILKNENEALRQQLEACRRVLSATKEDLEYCRDENERLNEAIENLHKQVESLNFELERCNVDRKRLQDALNPKTFSSLVVSLGKVLEYFSQQDLESKAKAWYTASEVLKAKLGVELKPEETWWITAEELTKIVKKYYPNIQVWHWDLKYRGTSPQKTYKIIQDSYIPFKPWIQSVFDCSNFGVALKSFLAEKYYLTHICLTLDYDFQGQYGHAYNLIVFKQPEAVFIVEPQRPVGQGGWMEPNLAKQKGYTPDFILCF